MTLNLDDLTARLREQADAAGVPADVLTAALPAAPGQTRGADYFGVLEWLVPRRGELPAAQVQALTETLEALLRRKAYAYPPPSRGGRLEPVVFGTGGHRGEIGVGLTLLHIHAIVTALIGQIEAMAPEERERHFGAGDAAEVKRRGFVIGHDNRLFNPEFAFYTAHLLREAGYRVQYAGRVSSPELSLLVPRLGWAGALNFTPSHNPFRYGGLKFNPADGGLAGSDLTDPLAAEANRVLESVAIGTWPTPEESARLIEAEGRRIERVDVHDRYLDALQEHPVIRLGDLIAEIKALPADKRLVFVADPVYGAAVPVYEALQRRLGADVLKLVHTEVDPYFGGQTTEPNEQTLATALELLRATPGTYKLAIRNDPDSDRGLVGDDAGAVKMNKFAPLVMRYLMDLGETGDLITTIPTSHLGPAFARKHGAGVVLTPTGFKNFREYLRAGALMAYEESDGITIRGHTLDKDGVLAGLLGLRMLLHYGKPLGEMVRELEAEMGSYYWHQETFMIDMSAAEAREKLKRLSAIGPGHALETEARRRTVTEVNTGDGFKFLLDDGAWLMMRPSGTEPKVRVYAETQVSPEESQALCAQGKALALEAVRGG